SDPWYMLDNAETALKAVDAEPGRDIPVVGPAGDKQFTGTMVLGTAAVPPVVPSPPSLPPVATDVLPVRGKPAVADAGDPELLALFLEEAHEEEAKITRHLPAWDQDPTQEDSLV